VSEPENGIIRVVKRRRTRRHRRHRVIRRSLMAVVLALCTGVCSAVAFRYLAPSLFSFLNSAPDTNARDHGQTLAMDEVLSELQPRPVYQYSLVPGGVEDVKELKFAVEHDPVMAEHYAGFDFDHAHVVELALSQPAYVSYRIGNHVYWMQRKITLHKGEKLITDGKMTARVRCANRVEQKPQEGGSTAEPPPGVLEQPGGGSSTQVPGVPFQSTLLNPSAAGGPESTEPMSVYNPIAGGNFIPIAPPEPPVGVCAPLKKGSGSAAAVELSSTGGKKKTGPCSSGSGPTTIPEPSTWILLISGLAAIFWQARRKLAVI
jgi:hypothetical protein